MYSLSQHLRRLVKVLVNIVSVHHHQETKHLNDTGVRVEVESVHIVSHTPYHRGSFYAILYEYQTTKPMAKTEEQLNFAIDILRILDSNYDPDTHGDRKTYLQEGLHRVLVSYDMATDN